MTVLTVLVIIVAAVAGFFLIKSKSNKVQNPSTDQNNSAKKRERLENTRWRAVEIRPGLIACSGITKIANKVYLASDAPDLPLGTCSENACQCKYLHLDDRRSGEDRRSPITQIGAFFAEDDNDDRRITTGRRAADLPA